MKKKELLLEVFSSPLIQNLIKQGFMTKEQLVEFVLYETVDDDDLPIDPAVDPPEEEEEEEETPEMPAINQPGHDMKMIRLAAKMAIQAGVKILKILKKIDIAIKFETVIDATGVPVRKIPDDLKTSLEPEEVKKYEQLKLKLDGIQNKLDPHLTLKNNQVDKGAHEGNIVTFAEQVTVNGITQLSKENPEQFKLLGDAYSYMFQSEEGAADGFPAWAGIGEITVNGYLFSKEKVIATAGFIKNTNPLLKAVREQLKEFAGSSKELQRGQEFISVLNEIFDTAAIPEGEKKVNISIYDLFGAIT